MSSWLEESHLASEGIDYQPSFSEEMPSLGSVTCFYNEENIVEETLENLELAAEQSDFYKTIYAVDDGSDDSTAKLIEEYAKDSENIEYIQMENNTGKFGAQKRCTKQMDEDYWLSIDADSKIENPEDIDRVLSNFDQSEESAAMLNMKPETEGEGYTARFYGKMQSLEYTMRRGVDSITSNGQESMIVTASGTATLAKTEKVEEAMRYHSGNYAGDDRELTGILQHKMKEEVDYLPELSISTIAPETPREHLKQRRTWALGQINAVSEHPKDHLKALTKPSRYTAALGADVLGTATSPLLFNRAANEIAGSGDIETIVAGYSAGFGLAAAAYTNAALRGEALNAKTGKGKAKEFAGDLLGLAAMPAYKTATTAYSIPNGFRDKYTEQIAQEFRKGQQEANKHSETNLGKETSSVRQRLNHAD